MTANPHRFVELVRVSTRAQADRDTPEIQRGALDRLRRTRPGILVERIEALGVSGGRSLQDREDLLRLKELTADGAYDELRVYALDRLTRADDPRERMAVLGMALDASAIIVDTNGRVIDPADDSGMGELDFYLQTFFASRERKRIKRRTMDGRRKAAAEGRLAAGMAPYGLTWDFKASVWGIDEEAAAVVRDIYDMALEGLSAVRICDRLNARGLPSPTKRRWSNVSVLMILRHTAYRGQLNQTLEGQTFETPVPAIVEETTWHHVQDALDARRSGGRREGKQRKALFRKLARCGVCGRTMYTYHSRHYGYYRCASSHPSTQAPRCSNRSHRIKQVDEAVWSLLVARLRDPSLLMQTAAAQDSEEDDWAAKLAAYAERQGKLESLQLEVLALRRDDLLTEGACRRRLKEIKTDLNTLESLIEVAQRAQRSQSTREAARESLVQRLQAIDGALDALDFESRRALVESIIPRLAGYGVTLYPDGHVEVVGALDITTEDPEAAVVPWSASLR